MGWVLGVSSTSSLITTPGFDPGKLAKDIRYPHTTSWEVGYAVAVRSARKLESVDYAWSIDWSLKNIGSLVWVYWLLYWEKEHLALRNLIKSHQRSPPSWSLGLVIYRKRVISDCLPCGGCVLLWKLMLLTKGIHPEFFVPVLWKWHMFCSKDVFLFLMFSSPGPL